MIQIKRRERERQKRNNNSENDWTVPWPVFREHCDERKFIADNLPGHYRIVCRIDHHTCEKPGDCPVANHDNKILPLKSINRRLNKRSTKKKV